jgi:hypothetical protein
MMGGGVTLTALFFFSDQCLSTFTHRYINPSIKAFLCSPAKPLCDFITTIVPYTRNPSLYDEFGSDFGMTAELMVIGYDKYDNYKGGLYVMPSCSFLLPGTAFNNATQLCENLFCSAITVPDNSSGYATFPITRSALTANGRRIFQIMKFLSPCHRQNTFFSFFKGTCMPGMTGRPTRMCSYVMGGSAQWATVSDACTAIPCNATTWSGVSFGQVSKPKALILHEGNNLMESYHHLLLLSRHLVTLLPLLTAHCWVMERA